MKYVVEISGGFTGIPKRYEGELSMTAEEEKSILDAMTDQAGSENPYLRDSQVYTIELTTEGVSMKRTFTEPAIPDIIRRFMEGIRQEKDTTS